MMNNKQLRHLGDIPIIVIRSKRRRSIGIQLVANTFTLRVPHRASDKNIQRSLERFTPWIRQKQAALASRPLAPVYNFRYGEHYPWLDTKITLGKASNRAEPRLAGNQLLVHLPTSVLESTAYIKKRIVHFYKSAGLQHFSERVDYFAERVGKRPTEIKVYSYKRRWGSCSNKGVITFNWQILLAPAAVADYVIVHELAHLIHFDHSKPYWQVVERVMPDYRTHRKWIKDNGHLLTLDADNGQRNPGVLN
ncbi:MAG: M48 family metallopeptidase [Proteobacteria bacterium]|jgi:predicted metal-dependent hydrolase|nr:M48 family metallopeptidase [Pseudomonadota bacterium]